MKAYLVYLSIPAAVAAGLLAARYAPTTVLAGLPSVQSLKVPLAPQALPLVQRREPALVDLRPLMHVGPPRSLLAAPKTPLVIAAIFVDGDRRVTQIGGKMYQKGDMLDHYRVERIEPRRVLLVSSGRHGERLWVDMSKGY